jgi:glycine dehydrogenase subunit 1
MPYLPHTAEEVQSMLEVVGCRRIEDLFRGVPAAIRLERPLRIPARRTEAEVLAEFERLARKNRRLDDRPSFLGAGSYRRFIPAAIDYLSSRGEFNTSYTPYQPEVSQGTLQVIFEYQTLITRLTGMEISNASMYEAATALAEAVLMAYAVKGHGTRVLVSAGVHPEYRRVLATYLRNHPIEIAELPLADGVTSREALTASLREDTLAVAVQNPNFLGSLEDLGAIDTALGARGTSERPFFIAVADPIALGVLEPPGSFGADVVIGDGQQIGNYPAYGGPTFGFFTTRMAHVRKVPGRIAGETRDRDGKRGYVLTFQTREQHIRRERATSNICTNQGLLSLRGAMYLTFLGEAGLREVAEASARRAHGACRELLRIPGVTTVSGAPFLNEFPLRLPLPAAEAYRALDRLGIGGGLPLSRYFPEREHEMLFACTEMTTTDDVARLAAALREVCAGAPGGGEGSGRERRSAAPRKAARKP